MVRTPVRRFLPLSRCARPQTALALQSSLHNIGWTLFLVVAYLMVQIVCKAYKACPRAVPLSAPRPRHEPAATATHAKNDLLLSPLYSALLSFLPPDAGTQSTRA